VGVIVDNFWSLIWIALAVSAFGGLAYWAGWWRGRKSVIEELQAEILGWVVESHLILKGDENGLFDDVDDVELEVPQQQSKENDGSTADQT
jgi:hypothetical protein